MKPPQLPHAFRYDLHLHSQASHDCNIPFMSLIRMTRRRGLSGIALTDHDTMEGYHRLAEIWPHDELQLIAGCERTLHDGSHVIGLFLQRPLLSGSIREVISEIRDQGALVYLPHPYREYSGIWGAASGISEADRDWAAQHADFIEVFNHKCTPEENRLALELLSKYPKGYAAGSDAHFSYEIGTAVTEFDRPLTVAACQPQAAYAPRPEAARKIARAIRRERDPKLRALLKEILKHTGMIRTATAVRNGLRAWQRPHLQRYP
jgi:predicted metal-dependent phosphoesterase TrpH